MRYKVKIVSYVYVNADDIFEAEDKATEMLDKDFEVDSVLADLSEEDNDDMEFERLRDERCFMED